MTPEEESKDPRKRNIEDARRKRGFPGRCGPAEDGEIGERQAERHDHERLRRVHM